MNEHLLRVFNLPQTYLADGKLPVVPHKAVAEVSKIGNL